MGFNLSLVAQRARTRQRAMVDGSSAVERDSTANRLSETVALDMFKICGRLQICISRQSGET